MVITIYCRTNFSSKHLLCNCKPFAMQAQVRRSSLGNASSSRHHQQEKPHFAHWDMFIFLRKIHSISTTTRTTFASQSRLCSFCTSPPAAVCVVSSSAL